MNMDEYLDLSEKTTSDNFFRKEFPADKTLAQELKGLDMGAAMADAIKRAMFYGSDLFPLVEGHTKRLNSQFEALLAKEEISFEESGVTPNMIHAALGLMGETGELFEEFTEAAVEGRPVDLTNLKEEMGDLLWYFALMLRELGLSFEEVGEANIAKLKARYPEGFTKENAENRDLDKEREAVA